MNADDLSTMDILNTLGWFREMYETTEKFYQVITGTSTVELIRWMKRYWKTGLSTLNQIYCRHQEGFQGGQENHQAKRHKRNNRGLRQ